MTHLKLYVQGCALFLLIVLVIGFIVPGLLSADDMLLPWLGVILLLSVPPAGWFFYRHVVSTLKLEKTKK